MNPWLMLEPPRERPECPEYPFVGCLEYQGVVIDVETAAEHWRRGTDPDGKTWAVRMPGHYGEVRGTVGPDGDAVDVYVGKNAFAPFVYVIQTKYPGDKTFDETKAFCGYDSRADAIAAFREAYNKPGFMLGVTIWPFGAWKHAIENRPDILVGKMDEPLQKARMFVTCRKAVQQPLFHPTAPKTANTHASYKVHCPVQLTTSGLAPRRWRCVDHETHHDTHPLDKGAAVQFMTELMDRGGENHATATRLDRPEIRRLAAEGLIEVASNPGHFNYEHRVLVTRKGREVYRSHAAQQDRTAKAAQTSLLGATR